MATNWDQYTQSGLSNASNLMGSTKASPYPDYTSSANRAPAQLSYYDYTPNQPMAQINAPDYKGLMGSDYDKLQSALTQPGVTAANYAYNTGYTNLNNTMGGNGLYGSSIMANQAVNNLDRTYQNTLADNAAKAVAQRYSMEQQDLSDYNKFNSQNYATGIDQNKALYAANAQDASNRNAYNASRLNWDNTNATNQTNWANARDYEKYSYDLAKGAYDNQANEAKINQYLSLAGYGSPLTTSANNYSLQQQQLKAAQQAAADASSAKNTASWLGAAGTLGGGLLNSNINWSGVGDTLSNAFYGVGNWLDGY